MGKRDKRENLIEESEALEAMESSEMLDFDVWFDMRKNSIPKHHHKEIIKADFKARGLKDSGTAESFDEALRKYGIKLA